MSVASRMYCFTVVGSVLNHDRGNWNRSQAARAGDAGKSAVDRQRFPLAQLLIFRIEETQPQLLPQENALIEARSVNALFHPAIYLLNQDSSKALPGPTDFVRFSSQFALPSVILLHAFHAAQPQAAAPTAMPTPVQASIARRGTRHFARVRSRTCSGRTPTPTAYPSAR